MKAFLLGWMSAAFSIKCHEHDQTLFTTGPDALSSNPIQTPLFSISKPLYPNCSVLVCSRNRLKNDFSSQTASNNLKLKCSGINKLLSQLRNKTVLSGPAVGSFFINNRTKSSIRQVFTNLQAGLMFKL